MILGRIPRQAVNYFLTIGQVYNLSIEHVITRTNPERFATNVTYVYGVCTC
jgi:hypothetical protein